MEEHIQKIIEKEFYREDEFVWKNAAHEIATDMLKFIEWVKDECEVVFNPNTGKYVFTNYDLKKVKYILDTNEIFTYWLDNVKNK